MKKLISFILAVLMLFPLSSCDKEAEEKQSSEQETLLSGSLENGGRWFYGEMSYSGIVAPLEGTYERERTKTVYLNDILTNGAARESFSAGTVVKVEYDGELFLPSGHAVPIISNLYSISFGVYPLESKEGKFTVACTESSFDSAIAEKIYTGESNGVFKVESANEFFELYLQTRPQYYYVDPNNTDKESEAYIQFAKNDFTRNFSYYSDEFFEDNILLLIMFTGGSGGDRFKVNGVTIEDAALTVNLCQTQSGQTCDISEWLFLVSVDRKTAKNIKEYNRTID